MTSLSSIPIRVRALPQSHRRQAGPFDVAEPLLSLFGTPDRPRRVGESLLGAAEREKGDMHRRRVPVSTFPRRECRKTLLRAVQKVPILTSRNESQRLKGEYGDRITTVERDPFTWEAYSEVEQQGLLDNVPTVGFEQGEAADAFLPVPRGFTDSRSAATQSTRTSSSRANCRIPSSASSCLCNSYPPLLATCGTSSEDGCKWVSSDRALYGM